VPADVLQPLADLAAGVLRSWLAVDQVWCVCTGCWTARSYCPTTTGAGCRPAFHCLCGACR